MLQILSGPGLLLFLESISVWYCTFVYKWNTLLYHYSCLSCFSREGRSLRSLSRLINVFLYSSMQFTAVINLKWFWFHDNTSGRTTNFFCLFALNIHCEYVSLVRNAKWFCVPQACVFSLSLVETLLVWIRSTLRREMIASRSMVFHLIHVKEVKALIF